MFLSMPACPIGVCSIGRFLRADNNNLKYLGITALAQVVSVNPVYATEHKALVIDCLDDPDETLKRKVGGSSVITDRRWPWRVIAAASAHHPRSMHHCGVHPSRA